MAKRWVIVQDRYTDQMKIIRIEKYDPRYNTRNCPHEFNTEQKAMQHLLETNINHFINPFVLENKLRKIQPEDLIPALNAKQQRLFD